MAKSQVILLSEHQKQSELQKLERRLEEGYRKIDLALSLGEDASGMEAFWLALLRQYEELHDFELQAA